MKSTPMWKWDCYISEWKSFENRINTFGTTVHSDETIRLEKNVDAKFCLVVKNTYNCNIFFLVNVA